ncbi:MAG: toll/interleukin-1 receptor domain-containing protein [Hyphomonadaceae bacterium JAD_PAG50586_4]|nr:MAG: toll/interleukin-1 receptor domain-containing protein [Hyphomonadaceae bacterium JAD_PAG50586_4]
MPIANAKASAARRKPSSLAEVTNGWRGAMTSRFTSSDAIGVSRLVHTTSFTLNSWLSFSQGDDVRVMSFVFVSHASQDKPRVKRVVDALRAAGFKIWLDNPVAAGYSAEELPSFYRIRANGRWEDEIDEAKREAACILVCWSVRATTAGVLSGAERLTWLGEADYGRVERKLVACTIDDVNPAALPGTHSAQQMPCVDPVALPPETWLAVMATLIDDIRRKIDEKLNLRLTARTARQDIALPLLADRSRQEDDFYSAVSAAAGEGGVHPVVLKGPSNELPEAFLERMEKASGRLRRDGSVWFRRRIDWPKEARDGRDFVAAYRAQLWRRLELVGRTDDRGIAEHLEQRDLTAILHRVDAKNWRRREEPELIRAWLDYWASLAGHGRRIKVVPILIIPLPKAKPGWRDCPSMGSGGRVGVRDIWKSLRRFADGQVPAPTGLKLTLPPVLGPISKDHGEDWLRDELGPLDAAKRAAVEMEMTKMFARGRAKSTA